MEEGRIDRMIIRRNSDELKTELKKIRTQIIKLQKKQLGQKIRFPFAYYRISDLKQIIEKYKLVNQTYLEDLWMSSTGSKSQTLKLMFQLYPSPWDVMPPKRTSTSAAPAMTQDAIRQLVADSVATALKAQAANMANTDNTNKNTGTSRTPVARKGINNHKRKFKDRGNTTNNNNYPKHNNNNHSNNRNNNNYQDNNNKNNHNNDYHQQQNRRQETVRTYPAKKYHGNLPLCTRCTLHHTGVCTVKVDSTTTIRITTTITTVTMITIDSRIEDKKPSELILPPIDILETFPSVKDVDYITRDLAVSSVRISTLETTLEDIQVHQNLLQSENFNHQATILGIEAGVEHSTTCLSFKIKNGGNVVSEYFTTCTPCIFTSKKALTYLEHALQLLVMPSQLLLRWDLKRRDVLQLNELS
ncbi:hypothetical protein Tco_1408557 [Tanacetum coccineum]